MVSSADSLFTGPVNERGFLEIWNEDVVEVEVEDEDEDEDSALSPARQLVSKTRF